MGAFVWHLLPYCKFVVAGSQIRRRLDVAELSPTVALIVQWSLGLQRLKRNQKKMQEQLLDAIVRCH